MKRCTAAMNHRALLHAEILRLNPRRPSYFFKGVRFGIYLGVAIACAWAVGWVLLFGVVTR